MSNPIIEDRYHLSKRVADCQSREEVITQLVMHQNWKKDEKMMGYRLYKLGVELKRGFKAGLNDLAVAFQKIDMRA